MLGLIWLAIKFLGALAIIFFVVTGVVPDKEVYQPLPPRDNDPEDDWRSPHYRY
jgi:hypothetical protein